MGRRIRALAVLAASAAVLAGAAVAFAAGDPERPKQWGLDMIGADAAHATATGTGAVVAIVDTGVQANHPDLAGRLLPGHDFANDDDDPADDNGHGTHVSGIVAADTGNGVGVASVAPGAKILPVKVLDQNGAGDASTIAKGIDWATGHGAQVINLSLGDAVPLRILGVRDEMDDAVNRALDKGVIVVAAAGNSSLPVCANPDGGGRLLCVGAVDRNRNRSLYSDYGNGMGITAPGGAGGLNQEDDILSTWNDGAYQYLAGTSQAAPHVSGVAALLVSMGVRGQDAVKLILGTASDAGPPGPDSDYGAGIVDAAAAVRAAKSADTGVTPGAGASAGSVSVRKVQRIRTVLRRGVRVACRPARAGSCTVTVTSRGRAIARGSKAAGAGQRIIVYARATKRGRRLLKRSRRVKATVKVRLPGGTAISRPVTLTRS